MIVTVFGATGFIGKRLQELLAAKNHTVILADLRRDADWESKIQKADAVVNLAGSPIFGKRWSTDVKAEIHRSRIEGTRKIVASLGKAQKKDSKLRSFISASAIGFYGPRDPSEELTEESSRGHDFLAFVCHEWEQEALAAQLRHQIRSCILRIGIVLGKNGGAMAQLLTPFKLGLGGPIGDGSQAFSWVHIDDVVGLILHALENPNMKGIYNACSPNPVSNLAFSKTLGAVLGRPAFLPVPKLGLYLGLGEVASLLTQGQKVYPKAALASGYTFKYPSLEAALKSIV